MTDYGLLIAMIMLLVIGSASYFIGEDVKNEANGVKDETQVDENTTKKTRKTKKNNTKNLS
jgi:hypothetical protein